MKKDNFGVISLIVSIILYILAIIFFVSPLPYKMDTFIIVSWLFVPGIVGSVIYIYILKANRWGSDTRLK